MSEVVQLYDQPILLGSEMTLTEQVHDILRSEIHRNRWKVGERLPSISQLADETGLSRCPVQRAFEQLREEGYIDQKPRRGTFLASLTPRTQAPKGAIGVAALMHKGPQRAQSWPSSRLEEIIEAAASRNYQTEVVYLKADEDWPSIDRMDGPFSSRVKGVISIHAFPRPDFLELPPSRRPLVFLGDYSEDCSPCVYGDEMLGFYHLTRQVLEAGHQEVAFCASPALGPHRSADGIRGHLAAMSEANQPVDKEAIVRSKRVAPGDLTGLRDFIERRSSTTAFIGATIERLANLIAVAEVLNLRVPEDLSIVGQGPASIPLGKWNLKATVFRHDRKRIVARAVDCLIEQVTTRHCAYSHVRVKPMLEPGDTLASPRDHLLSLTDRRAEAELLWRGAPNL